MGAVLLVAFVSACLATSLAGHGTSASADGPTQYYDTDFTLSLQRDGQWSFVTIAMLMADDGTGDFQTKAAAARADVIARFDGAVPIADAEVSAQYVLNSFRWADRTATWSYNPSGKPTGLTGDADAVAAAAASWATVGANFHFSGDDPTTAIPRTCQDVTDGRNTVGWYAQSGSVLAMTCTYWNSSGNATEFDMEIDPAWNWTTNLSNIKVDLQSVVAHEFGHALGLKHPCDFTHPATCSASDRVAMMYGSYTSGTNNRIQQSDDIAAILTLYGGSAAPTPMPVPRAVLTHHVAMAVIAHE